MVQSHVSYLGKTLRGAISRLRQFRARGVIHIIFTTNVDSAASAEGWRGSGWSHATARLRVARKRLAVWRLAWRVKAADYLNLRCTYVIEI